MPSLWYFSAKCVPPFPPVLVRAGLATALKEEVPTYGAKVRTF